MKALKKFLSNLLFSKSMHLTSFVVSVVTLCATPLFVQEASEGWSLKLVHFNKIWLFSAFYKGETYLIYREKFLFCKAVLDKHPQIDFAVVLVKRNL